MNEKICILNVYFGKMPTTFPLWLKSAQHNNTIDFLIVTDQRITAQLEKNIKILNLTFQECVSLIAEKLKMSVAIKRPYKLCDFRPAYGMIFSDYIKEYDYWGSCDIDLIFGDIRTYTDKYNLSAYDKFLIEGHLALYRNTVECNSYFKHKGSYYSYDEVFTNEKNYCFDESDKINAIYWKNCYPIFSKVIYANINPAFKRFQICSRGGDYKGKNYNYQVFFWENGHIYRAALIEGNIVIDEYLYIHLLHRKMPVAEQKIIEAAAFYITDTGYTLKKTLECSQNELIELSHYEGFFKKGKEHIINQLRFNWSIAGIKRRVSHQLFKSRVGTLFLNAVKSLRMNSNK